MPLRTLRPLQRDVLLRPPEAARSKSGHLSHPFSRILVLPRILRPLQRDILLRPPEAARSKSGHLFLSLHISLLPRILRPFQRDILLRPPEAARSKADISLSTSRCFVLPRILRPLQRDTLLRPPEAASSKSGNLSLSLSLSLFLSLSRCPVLLRILRSLQMDILLLLPEAACLKAVTTLQSKTPRMLRRLQRDTFQRAPSSTEFYVHCDSLSFRTEMRCSSSHDAFPIDAVFHTWFPFHPDNGDLPNIVVASQFRAKAFASLNYRQWSLWSFPKPSVVKNWD